MANRGVPLADSDITHFCGQVALSPTRPVVAGSLGTWTFEFTAGLYGMDIGATLKLAFRLASDWGEPQTTDPAHVNYLTATCSNPTVRLHTRFDKKGYVRPWTPAVVIDVLEEPMAPGDKITITLGDRSAGSLGAQAQTFVDDAFGFLVAVDPLATGIFARLPDPLELPIVSGVASRLRIIAPGMAVPGELVSIVVRAEDEWGNLAVAHEGTIGVSTGEFETAVVLTKENEGFERVEFVMPDREPLRVQAVDRLAALAATSNPIARTDRSGQTVRLFWGDIHGQTGETVGTGSIATYFPNARDKALLDFSAHAANDFQVTSTHYQDIQREVKAHNDPGRFVTFLGFEWSGNTPGGGDHNVYFLHDDEPIHRSSHWQLEDWSDAGEDRYPITAIYDEYQGRSDVMVIPHIGGRRANLEYHDESLTPFIEINSVHGRFEWFARDAMERGLRVGFVANSDDHTDRVGAAYPTERHRVRGGLMGVWAQNLTREALWDAFRARRVYGTSGERIALQFSSDGHPMGSAYPAHSRPVLHVVASGTAGIDRVEFWQGPNLWRTYQTANPAPGTAIKVIWAGSRSKGRNRRLRWDGHLTLEGGIISGARTVGFDTPRDGIVEQTAHTVRWVSSTVGDPDGLILSVVAPDDARLRIVTPVVEREVTIGDLRNGDVVVNDLGLDREVRIGWLSTESPPLDVDVTVEGEHPRASIPYWVRVVQEDGEVAWSSPIFVDAGP